MPESQNPQKFPVPKNWIINAMLIITLIASYFYFAQIQKTVTEPVFDIPYSQFRQLLNDGALASFTLRGNCQQLSSNKPGGVQFAPFNSPFITNMLFT